MLATSDLIAFVPTRDPARARRFYEETLGLPLLAEDAFAVVFDANGIALRVVNVAGVPDFTPAPFTILGWDVSDVEATVRQLASRGVSFARYPGMQQDALGIWRSPSGARVAWFKDPDGNTLSVTQLGA